MRYVTTLLLLAFSTISIAAEQTVDRALAQFAWEKRQLIVFASNLERTQLKDFQRIKKAFSEDFSERNLHVWVVTADDQLTLENVPYPTLTASAFYERFNVAKDDFNVLLLGYDQGEKLRQSTFNIDEILGTIDQMPMRQQEMLEQ